MKDVRRWLVPVAALCAAACGDVGDELVTPEAEYQVTFEDEFEGAAGALPDLANWQFDLGTGPNGDGWGNQELQFYTGRPDNVSLDGAGHLRITARREAFGGRQYTSARIRTQGNFEQRYGRFEARIKIPAGEGLWPAFWMLGNDFPDVGWPFCGEIDVLEFRGHEPNRVIGSVHGPGYSAGDAISGSLLAEPPAFDDDFHTYAVEWDPGRIAWTVDGVLFHTVSTSAVRPRGDWVFEHPFFMILNLAVGGNFVRPPTAETPFPAELLVDYVRVYERVPE